MSTMLIISTSACVIAFILPAIIKYIVSWSCSDRKEENALRKEILNLEKEMTSVSMVDEFARYTKIQRKHTKLKENFKNYLSAKSSSMTKYRLFFTYGAQAINAIVILFMMQMYRGEPVIILPERTLWPLDDFLSWPSVYKDSISLSMWFAITKLAMSNSLW